MRKGLFPIVIQALVLGSCPALAGDLRVGERTIHWELRNRAGGSESLIIEYTPDYAKVHEYWDTFHGNPRDATPPPPRTFRTEFNSKSILDWRVINEMDLDVLYKISPVLQRFIARNSREMNVIINKIYSKYSSLGLDLAEIDRWQCDDADCKNVSYFCRTKTGHESCSGPINQSIAKVLDDEPSKREIAAYKVFLPLYLNLAAPDVLKLRATPHFNALLSGGAAVPATILRDAGKAAPDLPPRTSHLVVVHANFFFDEEFSSKAGIDAQVRSFKQRGLPVVYLMHDDRTNNLGWFTADRQPTHALYSAAGEHHITPPAAEMTIVGGYFGDCQGVAMRDSIRGYFARNEAPFTIHIPTNANYFRTVHLLPGRKLSPRCQNLRKRQQAEDDCDSSTVTMEDLRLALEKVHAQKGEEAAFDFLNNYVSPASIQDRYSDRAWPELVMRALFGPWTSPSDSSRGTELNAAYEGEKVTTKDYKFVLLLNGVTLQEYGTGSRVVNFSLESPSAQSGTPAAVRANALPIVSGQ